MIRFGKLELLEEDGIERVGVVLSRMDNGIREVSPFTIPDNWSEFDDLGPSPENDRDFYPFGYRSSD